MDYGSVLWYPVQQKVLLKRCEAPRISFTKKAWGMRNLDYWERLSQLGMYSQERRRERYMIIFLWKLAEKLVQGYKQDFVQNPRRGRLAVIHHPPTHQPPAVRKAREASLPCRGSKLFNLIPRELRGMSGTVLQFKVSLDVWLSTIPDQPTVNGRQRAAKTNSLIDQVPMHQQCIDPLY